MDAVVPALLMTVLEHEDEANSALTLRPQVIVHTETVGDYTLRPRATMHTESMGECAH